MIKNEPLNKFEIDSTFYETRFTPNYLRRKPYEKENLFKITAFIPGIIRKILVQDGKKINAGDQLLILEAMKMENILLSSATGKIKKICVTEGDTVTKNQLLIELE
jgi:biotin carboxyl carrier protein